jgi:hypothetical protein
METMVEVLMSSMLRVCGVEGEILGVVFALFAHVHAYRAPLLPWNI